MHQDYKHMDNSADILKLPGMNASSLERLAEASALILGLSETGLTAAQYLIKSGLGIAGGKIGLVGDNASVAGAKNVLDGSVQSVEPVYYSGDFNSHKADDLIGQYDLVIDAMDDWQPKLLASDTCMSQGRSLPALCFTKHRLGGRTVCRQTYSSLRTDQSHGRRLASSAHDSTYLWNRSRTGCLINSV